MERVDIERIRCIMKNGDVCIVDQSFGDEALFRRT